MVHRYYHFKMKKFTQTNKINHLKGFLIFLGLDSLAVVSYLGIETLIKINSALSSLDKEIIVNEVSFYTLTALFMPVFHILVLLNVYTPLSKKKYKSTFNKIYMILMLFIAVFSGYLVSKYVENELKSSGYHYCENLSYQKNVRGATHYVWRLKNLSCDVNH